MGFLTGRKMAPLHYSDIIMSDVASQITCVSIAYSDADQWKNQGTASLAFVREIDRWSVNSPHHAHKGPVTRKMFPFDDVIMIMYQISLLVLPRTAICYTRHRIVAWWRHQMETFSALLAICAGNSPVSGEFPAQRPVTRSFDVFFMCA